MQTLVQLIERREQAKDYGVYGQSLVRAGVAGAGHGREAVEAYIRRQLLNEPDNQSFRTTARGLREFFRILGFIDDSGEVIHVTELGAQAAAFANAPIAEEQVAFWRRAIRNMSHDGGDGEESHPYQVLLNLIARKPGIPKTKCALALEAKNDSPEELERIVALVDLPEEKIIKGLRISRTGIPLSEKISNWKNAVKVLPKLAEQLKDVIRAGKRGNYRYQIADAPGTADVGRPAPRRRVPANVPRAPRSSREVDADTIGTAGTAEGFDEVEVTPELDPQAAAAGVRSRRERLRRHNLLLRKLARRLTTAQMTLYENPFDALALTGRIGILVEVKTLDGTMPDERSQVSAALAQLLYYQAFLIPPAAGAAAIRMVALFEKQITREHSEWLNRQNIAVIWEEGEGFAGDALASNFLGRYLEELR